MSKHVPFFRVAFYAIPFLFITHFAMSQNENTDEAQPPSNPPAQNEIVEVIDENGQVVEVIENPNVIDPNNAEGVDEVVQDVSVLTINEQNSTERIIITQNKAIVVESAVPFAEANVANPAFVDVAVLSGQSIYILAKAPGRTNMTLVAPDGTLIANVDLIVEPSLAELKERLREIMPNEPVEVRAANGGIILSGRVSSGAAANRALLLARIYAPENTTNMMTIGGTNQVTLKVRFTEMQRNVAKQLGSSVSAARGLGQSSQQIDTGGFVNRGAATNPLTPSGIPIASPGSQISSIFRFATGGTAIDVVLQALETKGLLRTLAEPNITAISGQEAAFLAGGEIPISTGTTGDGQATIEFRPFGVNVRFTPTVLDQGLINLQIFTEVSEVDTDSAAAQAAGGINVLIRSNRAQTVVEMKDGQSIAIAGLLRDDFTNLRTQLPWLADVPILGTLFSSAQYNRRQTEMIIIVTAYIVDAVDGEVLETPIDDIIIPTERDLFLFGNVVGGKPDSVANQDFSGGYGYVFE